MYNAYPFEVVVGKQMITLLTSEAGKNWQVALYSII
jgi:hypothetical protein